MCNPFAEDETGGTIKRASVFPIGVSYPPGLDCVERLCVPIRVRVEVDVRVRVRVRVRGLDCFEGLCVPGEVVLQVTVEEITQPCRAVPG